MNTEAHLLELIDLLLTAKNHDDMAGILQEILTPAELRDIPKRLQIMKLLEQGVPQREIAKELGVGIATVTRGSKELKGRGKGKQNFERKND